MYSYSDYTRSRWVIACEDSVCIHRDRISVYSQQTLESRQLVTKVQYTYGLVWPVWFLAKKFLLGTDGGWGEGGGIREFMTDN